MAARTEAIRVVIADGSGAQLAMLTELISQDRRFAVAGTASNAHAALAAASRLRPDIIVLDSKLPLVDGFDAARVIMQTVPLPVVLLAADAADAAQGAAQALEAGALTIIPKPRNAHDDSGRAALLTTLRLMAGVRVVTRFPRRSAGTPDHALRSPLPPLAAPPRLLAMVASTGGPAAVRQILGGLGAAFPLPVVITQHISPGFAAAFAGWLDACVPMGVALVEHGEQLLPGRAYIAPDGCHLLVGAGGRAELAAADPLDRFCPSGDRLLGSAASSYGRHAIGVVLTGMGDDGAQGLRMLRERGGRTLAQDEASSVVYGMPKVAGDIGAVDHSVPLAAMASTILALVSARPDGSR